MDVLKQYGAVVPPIQRVRWIAAHLIAFPVVGRGGDGFSNWTSQRDQTPNLSEFERVAFKDTRRIFLHLLHLTLTLDDDLFGTRATDNQVKTLSCRKADREGHSADTVACAISRVVFALRFRRRGEGQVEAVKRLLTEMFEDVGPEARNSCIVTADRGYGKESFINVMASLGLSSVFIMPDHVLRSHPFVAASFLNPHREEEDEVSDGESGVEMTNDAIDAKATCFTTHGVVNNSERSASVEDRRRPFVINDCPMLGPAVFSATKALRSPGVGQRRITAVAVREHGTEKYSKVLRFMHAVPTPITYQLNQWVAVPKPVVSTTNSLFSGSTATDINSCEFMLAKTCFPLTLAQRCADWFTLRQFRVTGTNGGIIMRDDAGFLTAMGYSTDSARERTMSKWFDLLHASWFSSKVSTEAMMKGTANEGAVAEFLRNIPVVHAIFDTGMFAMREHPHLACSPDAVALVEVNEQFSTSLGGQGDIHIDEKSFWVAPVEIKTKVAANTVGVALELLQTEPVFCDIGDDVSHRFIPRDHLMQVVQQATVIGASLTIYTVASETGVLYTVFACMKEWIREACVTSLNKVAQTVVGWAHTHGGEIPSFVRAEAVESVESRWEFWNAVNEHVKASGPFRPLKLFKHATQSFYSKTRGGVDGATQQRAVLRSSGSHMQWEQKLICQVLKTVAINAFIAWRVFERRDLLQSTSEFRSLDAYRNNLNKVQSTADFMLDAALDLLYNAQTWGMTNVETEEHRILPEEQRALVALAAGRKRRRLDFFNSDKGVRLRLHVPGHVPKQGAYFYCALCGQHRDLKGPDGKNWRGHRTVISCQICSVNLCVRIYKGLRKTCWAIWHSTKELTLRHTPCPRARKCAKVAQNHEDAQVSATASTEPQSGPAPPTRDGDSDSTEEIPLRR